MCATKKTRNRRRGTATIEMVFMLPLLLTVGLIGTDFGRFAHTQIAVTNAARVAAGFGSMHRVTPATLPLWQAAVRRAAVDDLTGNGWFDAGEMVMPPPTFVDEANGLRRVEVTVSYPFQTLINWPFIPGYNEPFPLHSTTVMRMVY